MADAFSDPNTLLSEIIRKRKALSPFMQGILGVSDAPPVPGWDPSMRGIGNTMSSMVPPSFKPPVASDNTVDYQDPRAIALGNKPSGSMVDPARAGAEGFNIPNYIPQAQTAGGSGDYMSRLQNQQFGQGGIGSDYVAGGPQSPDAPASGATPSQDNSMFSFFGKPEATDALTAFGAGMLRGKDFSEGLANATDGVNKVAQQYRGLTPREVAILEQKASLRRKLSGQQVDTNNPYYDKNNVLYLAGNDENGNPFFYNTLTKEKVASADGLVRATDAAMGSLNRKYGTELGKLEGNFEKSVQNAPAKISAYDQMAANLKGSGVGTDVLAKTAGYLSDLTGTNIAGVDVTNRGVLKSLISSQQLIAAEVLQGQGQVTEAERKLLASSLVSMDTNEDAARAVLSILKKAEERKIDQFRKWQSLKSQNPNASFTQFIIDYKAQLDGQQGQSQQPSGSQSGNSPTGGTTSSGIKYTIE